MSSWCNNEYEHRRDAQRDFERGRVNRDCYDRHSFDRCKEVYTKEYDRCRREEERQQEDRRYREEQEQRRIDQLAAERRQQELEYEMHQADLRAQWEEAEQAAEETGI